MKVLMLNGSAGRNGDAARALNCFRLGRENGVLPPVAEWERHTNFIR